MNIKTNVIWTFLFLFSISCSSHLTTSENAPAVTQAKVINIIDGDTVEVIFNNGEINKIRLLSVNCPELDRKSNNHDYYALESSNYTIDILLNKVVYLESDTTDKDFYNRLLRYVWLKKPIDRSESEIKDFMFNADLISRGYAVFLDSKSDKIYNTIFVSLQNEAQLNKKGLWN